MSSSEAVVRAGRATRPVDWEWSELEERRHDPPAGNPPAGDPPDPDAGRAAEVDAAFERGRIEGERAGRERAFAELASALGTVRGVAREVRESRVAWARTLERNVAALATALARHIVEREIAQAPEILPELVGRAVASFPLDEALRVRVHPDDLAVLAGSGDADGRAAEEERTIRWEPDEAVVPGGFVVEGPGRIVDGRVDEALRRLYLAMIHG